ncbi:MAG TPA: CPBP family intramembrane glutamic endopeptidase [Phycisphaerales bacterium]|nr:CPBP family intramembrane glutamic endopeptidase [Phycisphaerales bacterium]
MLPLLADTPPTFSFPHTWVITLIGWLHLLFFGLLIPAFVIRNRKKLSRPSTALPKRAKHFQITSFELIFLVLLSLLTAWKQNLDLFPLALPSPLALAAGLAVYLLTVLYMRPYWRRAVQRNARVVYYYMPSNHAEHFWWIIVSTLAGIGEEITWRGVQTALLVVLVHNYWLASALVSISFGAAHMSQGWKSAIRIVIFSMGFHLLVWLSQSLYVAMAVHVIYDITAGLTYGYYGRKLGYSAANSPASNAESSP